MPGLCWLRLALVLTANVTLTNLVRADDCSAVRAVSASAQHDFVAHIVGEDPRHTERVDGEATYHLARSPMPELLRCDVTAVVLPPALECVPAESNLIPSIARMRAQSALRKIAACLNEPVIGPSRVSGSAKLLQWVVTDWREPWPTQYRVVWNASLSDPAWTLRAVPLVDDVIDDVGRTARKHKSKERACGQILAIVAAAQTDFRSTLGRITEAGSDMSLHATSLRLLDFNVKVGAGGEWPNMLFAERPASSAMSLDDAQSMGAAASRAISSCLQTRALRLADKVYTDGQLDMIWRLTDRYKGKPILVFAVVRYDQTKQSVSRTAIRVARQTMPDAPPDD